MLYISAYQHPRHSNVGVACKPVVVVAAAALLLLLLLLPPPLPPTCPVSAPMPGRPLEQYVTDSSLKSSIFHSLRVPSFDAEQHWYSIIHYMI